MSKAVLISIKPKWCDLIRRGRKTVEVRKTCPKLELPFNEVDSDYRCHKVDCCVRCNLHFCLCDKGWEIPLVSSHPCILDLSGVMAI